MKVLFLSSWYPTPANPGLGIFVKEHARAIKYAGADIRVLAVVVLRDEPYLRITHREYSDEVGIRTYEIVIYSRLRDIFHHLVPVQSLIAYRYFKNKIYPDFKPDVIHSNVVFPAGMLGNYLSRRLKLPHIITEHWSKLESFLKKPYLGRRARHAYHQADLILPVSVFLKKNMQRLMPELEDKKFRVVSNVISSDYFVYNPKASHVHELNFCAIATWATKREPDKYPELFIEALSLFQGRTSKNIVLTMIGGGDRLPELQQLCAAKGVNARFTGALPKKEIAEMLQKMDFLLHASRIETFGVVIVEALMTGTPVICSNVGALPELIDTSNGVLCENTVDSWVSALSDALEKNFDRVCIAESVKDKFSYKKIGNDICKVY